MDSEIYSMTSIEELSSKALRHIFHYDCMSGEIYWKNVYRYNSRKGGYVKCVNSSFIGKTVFNNIRNGYLVDIVFGKHCTSHRLAWALHYGEWPLEYIDHINGDKSDNRIYNLRLASASENGYNRTRNKNNTSGFKGVTWCKKIMKWKSSIMKDRKRIHIGVFSSVNEARDAYVRASIEICGEFRNND